MNSSDDSVYNILKDETRRKIILALKDKKEIVYSDLLKTLEIDNTGKLNYHLKILNGFVSKNENGNYALTEKGRVALKLLRGFPENEEELFRQWIVASLKSKESPNLLGVSFFWAISSIALAIEMAFNAVNIRTFIFPWIFFVSGLVYFIRYIRDRRRRKGFLPEH